MAFIMSSRMRFRLGSLFKARVQALLGALTLFVSIGCQSSHSTMNTESVSKSNELDDEGNFVYRLPEEGFAISLPPDWNVVKQRKENLEKAIDRQSARDPKFAKVADDFREKAQHTLFAGRSPKIGKYDLGSLVGVSHFPNSGSSREDVIEEGVESMRTAFDLLSEPKVVHRKTKYADADRVEFELAIDGLDGRPIKTRVTTYYYVTADDVYVVSFHYGSNPSAVSDRVVTSVCESFQPLKR